MSRCFYYKSTIPHGLPMGGATLINEQLQTSRTRHPPAPMSKRLGTLQIEERGEWANSDEQKPLAAVALPLFRAVAR